MRSVPAAAAMFAALACSASAEEAPPPGGFLRMAEAVTRYAVQTGVLVARSFAEITYEDISVDLTEGYVGLAGVVVRPSAALALGPDCVLRVDSLALGSETVRDFSAARIDLSGVDVALACLPPEPRETLAALGYDHLTASALTIDYDYHAGSSALGLTIWAGVENAIEIETNAEFSYFWFEAPIEAMVAGADAAAAAEGAAPTPVADLTFLEVAITDSGLLERAGPMIEGALGSKEMIPVMAEGGVAQALAGLGAGGEDVARLAAETRAAVERFLNNGDRLVITAAPAAPIRLGPEALAAPAALLTALSPRAANAVAARGAVIDAAIVGAALSGGDLAAEDRLAVGRALATGRGAPKLPRRAIEALGPLVESGHAEAALLSANAAAGADDGAAYRLALIAAAGGAPGAGALLDRIERRLDPADAIAAQRDLAGAEADAALAAAVASGDVRSLRDFALGAARGVGAARRIELAYGAALLAAAGGDRAAASLVDRLDRRYRRRAGGAWAEALDAAAERFVAEIWIGGGLAQRLAAP